MAIDIKTKMILEGEKEYSRGMKNADGAIKELNSRLKVAKSEFAKTGDAQKYAAKQTEILNAKIEEQEKAVKTAEEALKFFAENGVGESDEIMRKWRITLNNSQAYLNRLQKELNEVTSAAGDSNKKIGEQGKAFENAGEEAENYKDTLDRIDKNISFQTTLTKLSTVYNTVRNILGGIKDVSKEIWDFESQSAQWADEINTAASQAGVDAATYQSWRYASRFIDVTVDDLVNIQKKITEVMSNGSEESMMLFNQLGVPTRNADGSLRNSYDVMLEVANALGQISDQTNRAAIASKMLGEEYNKLWPLVDAGVPKWNALTEEAEQYGVVSQDSIDKLQALDDARQKLQAQLDTQKYELAGKLAPGFTEITTGLSQMLSGFNDFLASEKGQAVIERLNKVMGDIGGMIADVDLGTALDKFADFLEWLLENGETVAKTIGGIAEGFGAIKISKDVLEAIALWRVSFGSGKTAAGKKGADAAAASAAISGMSAMMPINWYDLYLANEGKGRYANDPIEISIDSKQATEKIKLAMDIVDGVYTATGGGGGGSGAGAGRREGPVTAEGIVDVTVTTAQKIKTAQEILDDMRSQVDISIMQWMSDSQNYMLVSGADMAIAYAEGIEANMWRATVAAAKMTAAARMATGAGYVGGSIINANMTLEGETVARLISPAVDGYIGVNVEGR